MSKIRVAVLRGGLSDEHKVSLWTGAAVLEHIDKNIFLPIDVIISKSGEWIVNGRVHLPEHILNSVDVVFNALHGTYGEDGTIQRFLDRYHIPYTGSKAYASSLAMNKVLTKNHLVNFDIEMAPHIKISRGEQNDIPRIAENIRKTFGPEYVVKPTNSGSSVGAMMVQNPFLLETAIKDALTAFEEVMVEVRIPGREATCGVINRYRGEDVYALPPVEIVPPPAAVFFNNEVKYNGETLELCPSNFSRKTKESIEALARQIHTILNLDQYSRSDFIVADDKIYFLEVNTLPGLTEESLFPKGLKAIGDTYTGFITHLLTDTMRHRKFS